MRVRIHVVMNDHPNVRGWVSDPYYKTDDDTDAYRLDAMMITDKTEADDIATDWKRCGWDVTVEPVEES